MNLIGTSAATLRLAHGFAPFGFFVDEKAEPGVFSFPFYADFADKRTEGGRLIA